MKQIFFLAGLPRSGNTLLSAILNQNPSIYVSPLSNIPLLIESSYIALSNSQNFKLSRDTQSFNNVMNAYIENYYSHIEKPIVIDRYKNWTTPGNLQIIQKHITPNPKILFTVRPVLEILASFLNLYATEKTDKPIIDQNMELEKYVGYYYKDITEARSEWLMRPNHIIDMGLFALSNLLKPENINFGHLIEYETIVGNPVKALKEIYEFLELPYYEHNFNRIEKNHVDYDVDADLSDGTHFVKPNLSTPNYKIEDILPKTIQNRFSGLDFWRKE